METKVCSECGRTLPVTQFHSWVKKNGEVNYLHQCYKCQRNNANRRFAEKKKYGEIVRFSDDILVGEIKKRGLSLLQNIETLDIVKELKNRGYTISK